MAPPFEEYNLSALKKIWEISDKNKTKYLEIRGDMRVWFVNRGYSDSTLKKVLTARNDRSLEVKYANEIRNFLNSKIERLNSKRSKRRQFKKIEDLIELYNREVLELVA